MHTRTKGILFTFECLLCADKPISSIPPLEELMSVEHIDSICFKSSVSTR